MPNLLLELEFDGRDFFGWQRQPKKRTVQEEIEKVLKEIFQEEIRIYGSGRLDRGVSALSFFANFRSSSEMPPDRLRKALNSLLPADIYVKNIKVVNENFNAWRDAKRKIYEYRILLGRSPLLRERVWEIEYPLAYERLLEAAQFFLGKRDFRYFVKQRKGGICFIKGIAVRKRKNLILIRIEGDRFLYKMVRRIVGALVDYARGRITREDIINSLEGREHRPYITAPARGLILVGVKY